MLLRVCDLNLWMQPELVHTNRHRPSHSPAVKVVILKNAGNPGIPQWAVPQWAENAGIPQWAVGCRICRIPGIPGPQILPDSRSTKIQRWAIICDTKFFVLKISNSLDTNLPWQKDERFCQGRFVSKLFDIFKTKKIGTTNHRSTLNFRTAGFRKDLWDSGDLAIPTSHSPLWDSRIFFWSREGPLF